MKKDNKSKRLDRGEAEEKIKETLQQGEHTQTELVVKTGILKQTISKACKKLSENREIDQRLSGAKDWQKVYFLIEKERIAGSDDINRISKYLESTKNASAYLSATADLAEVCKKQVPNVEEVFELVSKHLKKPRFKDPPKTIQSEKTIGYNLINCLLSLLRHAKFQRDPELINKIVGRNINQLRKILLDEQYPDQSVPNLIMNLIYEAEDIDSLDTIIKLILNSSPERYNNFGENIPGTIELLAEKDRTLVSEKLYASYSKSKNAQINQRISSLLSKIRPLYSRYPKKTGIELVDERKLKKKQRNHKEN